MAVGSVPKGESARRGDRAGEGTGVYGEEETIEGWIRGIGHDGFQGRVASSVARAVDQVLRTGYKRKGDLAGDTMVIGGVDRSNR
jgi:hypothetical protein